MFRAGVLFGLVAMLVAAGGCSAGDVPALDRPPVGGRGVATLRPPFAETAARPRLLALGDSLTAGLGLDPDQAYPSELERRLHAAGYGLDVVNGGVSGDTSAGGLRRFEWALDGDVRILLLALGANDGLRGLPVAEMKKNLTRIIERAKVRGIAVVLAGMEAPPNFGSAYTAEFRNAFRELAREHDVSFVPFLLEGIAGRPELNQDDGIHPNVSGARKIVDLLWPTIEPLAAAASRPRPVHALPQ